MITLDLNRVALDAAASGQCAFEFFQQFGQVAFAHPQAANDGHCLAALGLALHPHLLRCRIDDFALGVTRTGACGMGLAAALAGDGAFQWCAIKETHALDYVENAA